MWDAAAILQCQCYVIKGLARRRAYTNREISQATAINTLALKDYK